MACDSGVVRSHRRSGRRHTVGGVSDQDSKYGRAIQWLEKWPLDRRRVPTALIKPQDCLQTSTLATMQHNIANIATHIRPRPKRTHNLQPTHEPSIDGWRQSRRPRRLRRLVLLYRSRRGALVGRLGLSGRLHTILLFLCSISVPQKRVRRFIKSS
jgi:hypothetical protein